MVSEGPLRLSRLDYIGYNLMDARGQAVLEQYASGQLEYLAFVAALQHLTEAAEQ